MQRRSSKPRGTGVDPGVVTARVGGGVAAMSLDNEASSDFTACLVLLMLPRYAWYFFSTILFKEGLDLLLGDRNIAYRVLFQARLYQGSMTSPPVSQQPCLGWNFEPNAIPDPGYDLKNRSISERSKK